MATPRKPVVVITGASKYAPALPLIPPPLTRPRPCRGIGLAVSTLLLDKFAAYVVGISRHRSPDLDALAASHPDAFLHIECDMSVPA